MSLYAVVDPATGDVVKDIPDRHRRTNRSKRWPRPRRHTGSGPKKSTVAERAALVRRVAELHNEREELAKIIRREMGKPIEQAVGEVEFSAAIYEYYADNAEKLLADEPIALLDGEGDAVIRRSSVGVLLGIMPWNYPYYQVARFAGPNLCVGQHDPAQARTAVPRVGGGDPTDLR